MRVLACIIAAFLLWAPALQAATIEQQRDWFKQARTALNKQQMEQFQQLKAKLQDYPLTPYLDIWHARKSLQQNNDQLVAETLARYSDVPESINLRRAWVNNLAKRGQWPQVHSILNRFPQLASRLPETSMVASWRMGYKEQALQQFSKRWQQNRGVSSFSKPLHKAWLKQGHPTASERWNRITTLARHGKWRQIKRLSKPLSTQQKQWLTYWRSVQNRPEKALKQWPESMPAMPGIMIVSDGIKRLSRKDGSKAWLQLQHIKSASTHIEAADLLELQRHTALRAARQHIIEAADWLAALPATVQNENTRGWRTRLHILQQDWNSILQAIASMPETEQQQSRWVYWTARAAEAIGQPEAAKSLFAKLATERGYYSFLSAEHIGLPFRFSSSDMVVSDQAVAAIEQKPAIRRAFEWLQLGKNSKAAREWHLALAASSTLTDSSALADSNQAQWEAASALASRWGWHDQVIRAAFKANKLDALPDRFPLAFEKGVMQAAKATGLMPASIWSIIRQESAFNSQAVSYVGAKGLMQLMPKTARQVARKLGMGKGTPRLFSPAINIRLGSDYLAEQKQRFGNLALAAAAYNAGPHRVSLWLSRTAFDSAEAWIEAIPLNETRRYVQQVMAFVSVYEWRQAKTPSSLIARLNGRDGGGGDDRRQEISLNK